METDFTKQLDVVTVVGMRFHNPTFYDKLLSNDRNSPDSKRFHKAFITVENSKEYPNAIALYIQDAVNKAAMKIGYVKSEDASALHTKYPTLKNTTRPIINVSILVFSKFYTKIGIPHYATENLIIHNDKEDALSYINNTTFNRMIDKKESTMAEKTLVSTMIDKNADVARSAAFLEAGRIANNQVAKFAAAKAPLMMRGYVDTPVGKLLIANMANVAAMKFRKGDSRLQELTEAMMVEAWQEVYRIVDIEKMINEMLDNDSIKKALSNLETPAA